MKQLYEPIGVINDKWDLLRNKNTQYLYLGKKFDKTYKTLYESLKECSHKHMVKVIEVYEKESSIYVIEEYIQGQTLANYLDRNGWMSEKEVKKMIGCLCDVLAYLHNLEEPIIHRDIKPENIMIDHAGVVKLIDFNIARFYNNDYTQDTTILGTQGYASPEQFGFLQTDARSDIYSLGVLMNVMLCGLFPSEYLYNGKLKSAIGKCIAIDRNKRYSNVIELKNALKYFVRISNVVYFLQYIPGFRSKKLANMIVAISVYALLIAMNFSLNSHIGNTPLLRLRQFLILLCMLAYIAICTNFMNVKDKLGFFDSKKRIVRFFGYIFYAIVIILMITIINNKII